jgi:quinol monooxygenase YgiN
VYACSTTITAARSAIDAGVSHVQGSARPLMLDMAGCIGVSMLVDRTSGQCIMTSAWRDAAAMWASEAEVRPIRARVAEILGGRPEVEEWEIAIMDRDHCAGAESWVRATWVRIDPDYADQAVEDYRLVLLPQVREFDGFCSVSLMIDRSSGYAVSSVAFDRYEAMLHNRNLAAVVRERGAREIRAEIIEVGEFELAVAHLRVPELV